MPKKKPVRLLFGTVRVKVGVAPARVAWGPEAMDGVDVLSTTNAHEVLATPWQMKDRFRAHKAITASAKVVKGGCAVAYQSYPSATQTFTGTRTLPFILAAACPAGQGQTVRLISGLSGKR